MYKDLIEQFQNQIRTAMNPLVPRGSRVALLDYPFHSNVGDCLIWLGELVYLRERNCTIKFVSSLLNHRDTDLDAIASDIDIILLHGGGNFGTIWPQFQVFREHILGRYANTKIIQLPQSVYYADPLDVVKTAEVVMRHPNAHIMVRDRASLDLLQQHISPTRVTLCPDSAFMLGDLSKLSVAPPKAKFMLLSRTDKERQTSGLCARIQTETSQSVIEEDWLDEWQREKWFLRFERLVRGAYSRGWLPQYAMQLVWRQLAIERMRRGIRILSRGQFVVTDRLHAHILSILLGKKHIIFDNNNKKLSGFYKEWTHSASGVHLIEDGDVSGRVAKIAKCF